MTIRLTFLQAQALRHLQSQTPPLNFDRLPVRSVDSLIQMGYIEKLPNGEGWKLTRKGKDF